MPRVARIIADNHPCHITQRGNNRQDVFLDDDDRTSYLGFLKSLSEKYKVRVLGYCLMTNHVHLVRMPQEGALLAKAIGQTHFRYTQYFNRKYNRSGHLWQNRFSSVILEALHLVSAMRYIERNPVRIGAVKQPEQYLWSSARAHVEGKSNDGILDMQTWHKLVEGSQWKQVLREAGEEDIEKLRGHTMTGRPYGSERFIKRLERRLDRRLSALPVGRPQKTRQEGTIK